MLNHPQYIVTSANAAGQQYVIQQQQPGVQPQVLEIHRAPMHQQHHPAPVAHTRYDRPLVRGKTSPYGFFVKMCYEEHKKKYPNENVQVTEISKKCSQKWKTMTEDEKKRFYELAQKDAERYQAEVAAYGGEEVLRKRKRAKKDPNAPKRALSAFFFFSNDKRPEVQQKHPEWKVGQVAQELGRFWKALPDEERAIYDKKALEDKERYAEEMRGYRNELNAKKDQMRAVGASASMPAGTVGTAIYRTAGADIKPLITPGTITIGGIPQQVATSSGQPMQIIMQPGQLPMQILEEQLQLH